MAKSTRDILLEAAIEEFAAKGFDGATVRDICNRAGLNVNSVKYYFEDKKNLHFEAVTEAHRRVSQERPMPKLPEHEDPEEKLRLYIHSTMQIVFEGEKRNQSHHLLMAREMAEPSEVTASFVKKYIKPRFAFLDKALQELLPEDFSPIERHLLILSIIGQCMHYKVAAEVNRLVLPRTEYRQLSADRIANHIYRVTLAAIAYYRGASGTEDFPDGGSLPPLFL